MGYGIGPLGDGVVTIYDATDTVNGSGTSFSTQFAVGDEIVVIEDGTHQKRTISVVDSDVLMHVSVSWATAMTAAEYYGLRDANSFVETAGRDIDPAATPITPPLERSVSGVSVTRGYERATWSWKGMTPAQMKALHEYALGDVDTFSGKVYITSQDAYREEFDAKAILDWPNSEGIRYWGQYLLDIELAFIVVDKA